MTRRAFSARGLAALAIGAGLALAVPAAAQTRIPIQFERGASGATLNGTVIGDEYTDFVLGAAKGQVMTASLRVDGTNGDGTAYFNILPPGSDNVAIWIGSMEVDQQAEVTLPESGDYIIRVYLMGNDRDTGRTVGYSLAVSIR